MRHTSPGTGRSRARGCGSRSSGIAQRRHRRRAGSPRHLRPHTRPRRSGIEVDTSSRIPCSRCGTAGGRTRAPSDTGSLRPDARSANRPRTGSGQRRRAHRPDLRVTSSGQHPRAPTALRGNPWRGPSRQDPIWTPLAERSVRAESPLGRVLEEAAAWAASASGARGESGASRPAAPPWDTRSVRAEGRPTPRSASGGHYQALRRLGHCGMLGGSTRPAGGVRVVA
jgi:hypothetical protein